MSSTVGLCEGQKTENSILKYFKKIIFKIAYKTIGFVTESFCLVLASSEGFRQLVSGA